MKEQVRRYFCNEWHIFGNAGVYHYSDEVIYEKHIKENSVIEVKNEKGEYKNV